MAKIVGDIAVSVGADVSKLVKGFDKAGKSTRRFDRDFDKSADRMARSAAKITKGLLAISTTAAVAFGTLAHAAFENAKELEKLSDLAGTNVEDFQRMAHAASQYGVEQEKLADILKDTNDKIGDFIATGGGPLADFFDNIAPKVGVTIEQFARLSGPDALGLYVSSLEKAGVSQKEMVFYMEALASDATALLPILGNNADELNRLSEAADNLGIVLDTKTIEGTARMGRVWDQVVSRMQTVFLGMASNVLISMDKIFGITDDGRLEKASAQRLNLEDDIYNLSLKRQHLREAAESDGFFTRSNQKMADEITPVLSALRQQATVLDGEIDALKMIASRKEAAQTALEEISNRSQVGLGVPEDQLDPFGGAGRFVPQDYPGGDYGDGGGGGGRGVGPSDEDLERLQDSLLSENEIIIADYDKKLALLRQYRDNKTITEEEYNALERDMTTQHYAQLNQIQTMAQVARVNSVLGAGAEVLGALGSSNDKAFKLAQVFNAGMALMDAWGAYNKVLNDPTPQPWWARLAAGATVLASGIKAVQAIQSVSQGGGGAASGAAATGGAAQSETPGTYYNVTLQGDTQSTSSVAGLLDMINEAIRDGGRLEGITVT